MVGVWVVVGRQWVEELVGVVSVGTWRVAWMEDLAGLGCVVGECDVGRRPGCLIYRLW